MNSLLQSVMVSSNLTENKLFPCLLSLIRAGGDNTSRKQLAVDLKRIGVGYMALATVNWKTGRIYFIYTKGLGMF